MTQVLVRRALIAKQGVGSQVSVCGIYGTESGNETEFSSFHFGVSCEFHTINDCIFSNLKCH